MSSQASVGSFFPSTKYLISLYTQFSVRPKVHTFSSNTEFVSKFWTPATRCSLTPTHIMCRFTKFSFSGDLASGVYVPLHKAFCIHSHKWSVTADCLLLYFVVVSGPILIGLDTKGLYWAVNRFYGGRLGCNLAGGPRREG